MEKYVHTSRLFQSELHQSLWRSRTQPGKGIHSNSFKHEFRTFVSVQCWQVDPYSRQSYRHAAASLLDKIKGATRTSIPLDYSKKSNAPVFQRALKLHCNFLIDQSLRAIKNYRFVQFDTITLQPARECIGEILFDNIENCFVVIQSNENGRLCNINNNLLHIYSLFIHLLSMFCS